MSEQRTRSKIMVSSPGLNDPVPVEVVLRAARDKKQHVAFSPDGKLIVGEVRDITLRYFELFMEEISKELEIAALSDSEVGKELAQGIALLGLDGLARRVAISALSGDDDEGSNKEGESE
jgi:WD40 repeat protein